MRLVNLVPVFLVAACTSGPSKEESVQIWGAASAAMTAAQQRAVEAARASNVAPVTDLDLNWSGNCTLGGTVGVTGMYSGDGSDDHASFDLHTTFNGCREAQGTVDGDLTWKSVASGTSFTASMDGSINWNGQNGDSASCNFDLAITLTATSVAYGGSLCGYDVGDEINL